MSDGSAIARFTAFATISGSDRLLLRSLGGSRRRLTRGEVLRHEGDSNPGAYLLVEGWTASSITLSSGARQLLRINMPGDMLGSPSIALTRAADTILALSPATVVGMQMDALAVIFERSPRLAAILYLIAQQERVMLMDRLVGISRARAIESVAGLFIQLYDRHLSYHADTDGIVPHPLTQADAADLVGISTVHMNRLLHELRRLGLLQWGRGKFRVLDANGLRQLAGVPRRELQIEPDWLPASKE